jgi:3D (Asp-Asp-Asp) domain-containing protein
MVTGTTLNGNETFAGWASYFLDNSTVLPGRPATELAHPPAHCSYRASLLLDVAGFPADRRTGEDTVVNRELFRRGHSAYRDPAVRLVHSSPSRSLPALVRHHFRRGQGLAQIILDHRQPPGLLRDPRFLRQLGPGYVVGRIRQTDANVRRWGGRLAPVYRRVRTGVMAGAVAAWFGAWFELLAPREGWMASMLAKAPAVVAPTDEAELADESVVVRGLTTGYCSCSICCGEWSDGITAMLVDTAVQVQGASADFGLLPPGTVIHVDGYGTTIVDDTGGAMRTAAKRGILHLDIRFATHEEGLEWGARWVDVTVPASTRAAALATESERGSVLATGTT